jgi:CubicO group peptidase (beta-lactamase class C family)
MAKQATKGDAMTTTGHETPRRTRRLALLLIAIALLVAACGAGDGGTAAGTTVGEPATESTAASTPAAESRSTTLEAEITALLEAAMEPGAIDWTREGDAGDPTAVTAGVRMDGRDDVLVVVGTQADGTEAMATDPLSVGPLTGALARTIALQLVDEGILDPTATVDAWVPAMPVADVASVESLIEMRTGWSRWGAPGDDVVLDDLERPWTLTEVVDLVSPTVSVDPNPSVATTDVLMTDLILGHVLEQVTGEPLATLVEDRIAGPLGLADTTISDGDLPARYRHGVFDFDGEAVDTSMFPLTAYFTWHTATLAAVSSVPDLLDLLDAWQTGDLFTTDRTPSPERFGPERATSPSEIISYDGLGVPFNGYCPCTAAGDGHEVTAIGRTPTGNIVGTDTHALRYADGITVVVHFNIGQSADRTQVRAIADAIHRTAASSF